MGLVDHTRYKFSHFSLALRALQASVKMSLRIDDQGYLSMQLMMPSPLGKNLQGSDSGIIEFKMRALDDDD